MSNRQQSILIVCIFGLLWSAGSLKAQQTGNSLRANSTDRRSNSVSVRSSVLPDAALQDDDQQDNGNGGQQPLVSIETIEAIRKQGAEAADLDSEGKQKIETACLAALDGLRRVKELGQIASKHQLETQQIGERVTKLQQELEKLQQTQPSPPDLFELASLEAEVTKREAIVEKLKLELSKAESLPAERVKRRQEIRELLLTSDQRVADIQKQLETAPPNDEPVILTKARVQLLNVTKMVIEAERPSLINERGKLEAEDQTDLIRFQKDILSRQTNIAQAELQSLQQQLNRRRAIDLKYKRDVAESVIPKTPESIRSHAEENLEFADESNSLTGPAQKANDNWSAAKEKLEELQKKFKAIQKRVNEIGLTGSIGQLLRRQKIELPDLRKLRSNVGDRKGLIENTQYKIFEFDELRSKTVAEELQRIRNDLSAADFQELEKRTDDPSSSVDPQTEPGYPEYLVKKRREYLDDLIRNYKDYLDTLFDLDATEQRLILETQKYQRYIDERVLWIRSNKPLFSTFSIDPSDLRALDIENWKTIGQKISEDIGQNSLIYLLVIACFGLIIIRKPRINAILRTCSEQAEQSSCVKFSPTIRVALITILLSIIWPGILAFLAWRLNTVVHGDLFARALAQALFSVAWILLPLEILRRVCRRSGLAESHFEWPKTMTLVLLKNVRWFIPFFVVVSGVTMLLFDSQPEQGSDSIERCAFIVGMLILMLLLHRLFHLESGMLHEYYTHDPKRFGAHLQSVWYWTGILLPATLIAMTVMGFFYTAYRLITEIYSSFFFLLAIILLRHFLQRLLLIRRRIISIEQARERLAARNTPKPTAESDRSNAGVEQFVSQEDILPDIKANTEQTRKLIQTGFIVTIFVGIWWIWVDVLPAVKMLDHWPLWTVSVPATETSEVAGSQISPTGMPSFDSSTGGSGVTIEKLKPVTIADLGLAIIIGIVTFICARNIPGLMEITILQKLPMDKSVRYAFTTITSYVIVLLGLVFSFNAISIGWSKVQWLATALTFGLAFGLQEIFANFVAGLILLFERPIRVGDVVTIDGVDGVVSRIRIRATTITDWDRKEYVVPNKEFITGRMLNWTLSDRVNRVVINVGVAYGSDLELAKKLLKEICQEHPLILDDPSTLITFEGFGDNTLNLVLRTYLPDLENRLRVIDELHSTIDRKFRQAEIEIAFPQRDLHLRSIDPKAIESLSQITGPE